MGALVETLKEDTAHGVRTVCAMRAAGSAQRLGEILAGYGLAPAVSTDSTGLALWGGASGGLFVMVAAVREGFEVPGAALSILAEKDVAVVLRELADAREARQRAGHLVAMEHVEGDEALRELAV